jgi:hypothetical protein
MQEVSLGQWQKKRVRWEFVCDSGAEYVFSKNLRLE